MTYETCEVAIVGGGPAGLSAALILGRCGRRVIVCDHGKPRNAAATNVHGYLALDGVTPHELRGRAQSNVRAYGVEIRNVEVRAAETARPEPHAPTRFIISLSTGEQFVARKLLLATGVVDVPPDVEGIADFYGRSVHHCPYCDAWEHRGKHLAALGSGRSAAGLALSLRTWSDRVTACTNGEQLSEEDVSSLSANGIAWRSEPVVSLEGREGMLEQITFQTGSPLPCDALFFNADQHQRSAIPASLGCDFDDEGLLQIQGKQGSGCPGLFLAGDADGDVQFAIVAAAEGAIAATAINRELQEEDRL